MFKGGGFDTHYTSIPFSIGYDRQLSPRTTVGARLSATHTDYDGPGSVWVVTPQATFQTALSERMSFTGALGVSYASIDNGIDTHHSTGVAADASLCRMATMISSVLEPQLVRKPRRPLGQREA